MTWRQNWVEISLKLDQNQFEISYHIHMYYNEDISISMVFIIYLDQDCNRMDIAWTNWIDDLKIQSCIQLHPFNPTSKMLTPISSWNYGWKISKTNENYERRLRRSTFAGRLVAVPGIAGNRSLRPQHRWRRHTDDEPSRLGRRRRRTWRFGCRLLRPFVVWRPAVPVAPGKRRHAFALER